MVARVAVGQEMPGHYFGAADLQAAAAAAAPPESGLGKAGKPHNLAPLLASAGWASAEEAEEVSAIVPMLEIGQEVEDRSAARSADILGTSQPVDIAAAHFAVQMAAVKEGVASAADELEMRLQAKILRDMTELSTAAVAAAVAVAAVASAEADDKSVDAQETVVEGLDA